MSVVEAMFQRQRGILSPALAEQAHVTICGCGTVGSNVAVQLTKLGICKFDLWDMDTVGIHNIPSQDFRSMEDVGDAKVNALAWRISGLMEDNDGVNVCPDRIEGYEQFNAGTVVLAVDSMDVRKLIFDTSIRTDPLIDFVMDFRMGGPVLQAWAFDPRDGQEVAKYEKTLYSSAESIEMPCGTRTFAPVGALSGAIAAQLMTAHLKGEGKLPFYTMMDLANFTIATAGGRQGE